MSNIDEKKIDHNTYELSALELTFMSPDFNSERMIRKLYETSCQLSQY